jgi:hypothetical protein
MNSLDILLVLYAVTAGKAALLLELGRLDDSKKDWGIPEVALLTRKWWRQVIKGAASGYVTIVAVITRSWGGGRGRWSAGGRRS